MSSPADPCVRLGERDDAEAIGRLLHDFNVEFDEPTPSASQLALRIRGCSNREGKPDGSVNYFYEREL
jgi:hypothetical protein